MAKSNADKILSQISAETKHGELKKLAKELKTDHELALEIWASGDYTARKLAVLILDKKQLSQEVLDTLFEEMESHDVKEREYITDWLMANQLMKNKACVALILDWADADNAMQRRVFWYYQARLRWTGQTPPPNSEELIAKIEESLADEEPSVQWAMNFTAGQIGVHEPEFRDRCIAIGESTGLYSDEKAPRGCTPNYLPEFIRIESEKWAKKKTAR